MVGWRMRAGGCKDGSRFWGNVVITAVRDREGTLLGYGKITRDLTERVAAEQRLRDRAEREDAMPRPAWMAFKGSEAEFLEAEKLQEKAGADFVEDTKLRKNAEWKNLKNMQQEERVAFFADGKSEFSHLRS